MGTVTQVRMLGTPDDVVAVRSILVQAPGYAEAVHGGPFGPDEAVSIFHDLPPNTSADAKRVYAVRVDGSDVGVLEFIIGYPVPQTLMLGLLVLEERWQGFGYGAQSIAWLERHAAEELACSSVRLGVVARNSAALGFWQKMGYAKTVETKPWHEGAVVSEVIVFEKSL